MTQAQDTEGRPERIELDGGWHITFHKGANGETFANLRNPEGRTRAHMAQDAARAFASALQPQPRGVEREGWKLVPIEATEKMRRDGSAKIRDFFSEKVDYPRTAAMWKAMVLSAPITPEARDV